MSENPMRTVSAAERRAERRARAANRPPATLTPSIQQRTTPSPAPSGKSLLDQATVMDILRNPTRFVSPEELKRDYAYVLADVRNMFVLAVGLVVLLIVLALVLPR
jgi:hypothetical protein